MRKAAILFLLAALVVPAHAADDAKKGGKPGTNVEMPFLMAPLSNADGKLVGYAYVSTRLTATSDTYALAVRDKLPFIQDKMVRDVNSDAITTPEDPEKVDVPTLEKRLLGDATQVMGAGKVKLIMVCTVQIAELHPVQTPALNTPPEKTAPPGSPPPKNPVKSRCNS
ncbi:MAG TPA: hypothetical protein VGH23_02165 [Rhizomicrobium sp.]|jgi:hypothetical protein